MAITSQVVGDLDANAGTLRLRVGWTSGTGGSVGVVSEALSAATMLRIKGKVLLHFQTNPGATAPTTLYDLTMLDADGIDVLGGAGGDRSATVSEGTVPLINQIMDTALTFTIANAGDTKDGEAIFYFG